MVGKTLRRAEKRGADPQNTASPSIVRPRASLRRRILIGIGLLFVCGGIAAALILPPALRANALREAYLPELEAMAQAEPSNGPVLALLGARQAEANEFAASAQSLEQALAAGEKGDRVWLSWAAALAASGDRAKSGAALKLGLKETRSAPALQEAFERCKMLPADATTIALADALCPDGPHRLAQAYTGGSFLNGYFSWQARRHPAASGFTMRQQWAAQRPNDAEAQRLWAEALVRNRAYALATQPAEHAVALAPDSPDAHLVLGDALAAQGASGKAGLQYVTCLKLRPEWLPALMGLGKSTRDLKLLSMGVDIYTRVTKAAPESPDAWIGLGIAQYSQKLHLAAAVTAFEKAAQLAPNRTDFFDDYANALSGVFKTDEAEAVLRRRLAASPEDGRAHFLLALLLLDNHVGSERNTEAETHLRTVLQLEPDQSAAHDRLGKLLLQTNRAPEAVAQLEQAVQQDRYNTSALFSLMRAYRQTGRTQEAAAAQVSLNDLSKYVQRGAFLEDMVARQPLDIKLHQELAAHYIEGGQNALAQNHLDAARLLKTNNKQASQGLKILRTETTINSAAPNPTEHK